MITWHQTQPHEKTAEAARKTLATVVAEWDDEDTNGGEWPPPDHHQKSLITGQLADDVRYRLGVADGDVFLTETLSVGGWSENTEEHYWSHVIECDGQRVEFDTYEENGLACLLAWLDEGPYNSRDLMPALLRVAAAGGVR